MVTTQWEQQVTKTSGGSPMMASTGQWVEVVMAWEKFLLEREIPVPSRSSTTSPIRPTSWMPISHCGDTVSKASRITSSDGVRGEAR